MQFDGACSRHFPCFASKLSGGEHRQPATGLITESIVWSQLIWDWQFASCEDRGRWWDGVHRMHTLCIATTLCTMQSCVYCTGLTLRCTSKERRPEIFRIRRKPKLFPKRTLLHSYEEPELSSPLRQSTHWSHISHAHNDRMQMTIDWPLIGPMRQ